MSTLLVSAVLAGCVSAAARYRKPTVPPARRATPIARALEYLENTQVTPEEESSTGGNWAGNWPFYIVCESPLGPYTLVEVASGLPAFAHRALSRIHAGTSEDLQLTAEDIQRARRMRLRAMAMVERFRSEDAVDPSPYGWWPIVPAERRAPCPLAAPIVESWLAGPFLHGDRAPPVHQLVPPAAWMTADVDDTAYALCARLDHARLDGGAPAPRSIRALFEPWRDRGGAPRAAPSWLPADSGAFLTWMAPPRRDRMPSEVDPAINANVLLALARYGELDTPGAAEAVEVIRRAVREERHRHAAQISQWYPRRMFHLLVAHAWSDGPVPALESSVRTLAADLAREARWLADGSAAWGPEDAGEQALQTALAIVPLALAGGHEELVRAGRKRLLALQDPCTGGWGQATLCRARSTSGARFLWRSSATPFVLEALIRSAHLRDPASARFSPAASRAPAAACAGSGA